MRFLGTLVTELTPHAPDLARIKTRSQAMVASSLGDLRVTKGFQSTTVQHCDLIFTKMSS